MRLAPGLHLTLDPYRYGLFVLHWKRHSLVFLIRNPQDWYWGDPTGFRNAAWLRYGLFGFGPFGFLTWER